jgi:hypothetical protein
MVLQKCGRVGRRQPLKDRNSSEFLSFFFALNFAGLRFLSGVEGIPYGVRLFFFALNFPAVPIYFLVVGEYVPEASGPTFKG